MVRALSSTPTIAKALAHATNLLKATSSTPALDVRVLLQHCLGEEPAWLISHANEQLQRTHHACFNEYVERRRRGEPIAYITGRREFWSLVLAVNEKVLIPRPETEHLVEHALAHLPEEETRQVLDLGTGSGAIACAIAKERPRCEITATDVSEQALEVAAVNANSLGIHNVRFSQGDWFEAVAEQTFDMIVCNPPYIADDEPCLVEGDLVYEPASALRAGPEGLDAISVVGAQAQRYLRQEGRLVIEHGATQAQRVAQLLKRGSFNKIRCHPDLAGHPRVTEGCVDEMSNN